MDYDDLYPKSKKFTKSMEKIIKEEFDNFKHSALEIQLANENPILHEKLKKFYNDYNYDTIPKTITTGNGLYSKLNLDMIRIIPNENKNRAITFEGFLHSVLGAPGRDLSSNQEIENVDLKLNNIRNEMVDRKFDYTTYQKLYFKTKRRIFFESIQNILFKPRRNHPELI